MPAFGVDLHLLVIALILGAEVPTFSPNDNHPPKGAAIKVEPLRKKQHIAAIKKLLRNDPRNLCSFSPKLTPLVPQN
jgi:hypothetical protein